MSYIRGPSKHAKKHPWLLESLNFDWNWVAQTFYIRENIKIENSLLAILPCTL